MKRSSSEVYIKYVTSNIEEEEKKNRKKLQPFIK